MTNSSLGVARFVAFSTIDDEPWESSAKVGELLERVRELASLGIGLVSCTEIPDCGDEAGDVLSEGTTLAEARIRFPTVFRGDGVPGLMLVAL